MPLVWEQQSWLEIRNDHHGMFHVLFRCERDVDACNCLDVDLHVASVAEVNTRLVGTFVWSVLERDDVLSGLQLLIAEVSDILFRLFWSDRWLAKVLSLKRNRQNVSRENQTSNYLSSQRLQADDNRVQVLSFPQVNRLERFLYGNTEGLCCIQESWNVLHALECHFAFVNFLDGSWLKSIGQLAQDDSVLKDFEEVVHISRGVDWFSSDLLDPF